VPRLGPLTIVVEHDLARIRDLRLEPAGAGGEVTIRFDDDGGSHVLGTAMPRTRAEAIVAAIRRAIDLTPRAPVPPRPDAASERPRPEASRRSPADEAAPPPVDSPSVVALIAANVVPLIGVLFFGWDLANLLILYWAESAVIGFYTALKIAIVGRIAAVAAVPFFVGHFGGFMVMHFLLIYSFFVRGIAASGPDLPVPAALQRVFAPLSLSLATLFVSHGVSFFSNFIRQREYERTRVSALMTAPYNRIVLMQLTLIFGGWVVILTRNATAALALLVLAKTAADVAAHRKEHRATGADRSS
jgi:uncharacterized protein DUF6498